MNRKDEMASLPLHHNEEAQYPSEALTCESDQEKHLNDMDMEDWLAKHLEKAERSQLAAEGGKPRSLNELDDDAEAQYPLEANAGEDDQDIPLDGMEMEDWLAKNLEKAERSRIASEDETQNVEEWQDVDPKMDVSTNVEDWLLKHHEHAERSRLPRAPETKQGKETDKIGPPSNRSTFPRISTTTAAEYKDDDDDDDDQQMFDASVSRADAIDAILTAELAPTRSPRDDQLLVEGVKTTDPKRRRFVLGCVVVCSVVAVIAIVITVYFTSQASSAPSSSTQTSFTPPLVNRNVTGAPTFAPPTMAPTRPPEGGNLNWTIADFLESGETQGPNVGNTLAGPQFLAITNRTDINFTRFAYDKNTSITNAVSLTLITKFFMPLWNGHVVSA